MGEPFVGEIRMFGGNFAPAGWALCQGQLMAIAQNDTLFQLIGTTYGGDGQSTFAIPDLQGRAPMHVGPNTLGEKAGVETVTLTTNTLPIHTHSLFASTNNATDNSPTNNFLAAGIATKMYTEDVASLNLSAQHITSVGSSQPHDNMQPYLTINFILSLFGVFPSQN